MKRPVPRSAVADTIVLVVVALATLGLAMLAQQYDMPQKWDAAIFGTLVPFAGVIGGLRRRWSLWSFWASTLICFVIHCVLIWIIFQYVLSDVQKMAIAVWLPIAFVELFVLLVPITALERVLRKHTQTRV